MEWLSDPATWTALVTLFVLEVVLGVDNVIFISILAGKLPPEQQARARQTGLLLAAGMRLSASIRTAVRSSGRAPLASQVMPLRQSVAGTIVSFWCS